MWEKINKFVRSQAVFSALLLSVLFTSIITAVGILIFDLKPPVILTIYTVGQLALSGTIIWLMQNLKVFNANDFKLKGIGKGFLLAWFGFLFNGISFFINFMSVPENSFIVPNTFYLLIVILHPIIGTGLFEEVLYRGLVLKMLLKKTGDTKKGIIFACIISSVVFGLVAHIPNLLAGTRTYLQTVNQIITAITAGLFFAAVFVRTKKLWITILLHGLLNLSAQIFDAITSMDLVVQNAEQTGTDIGGYIFMTLLEALPILIAGLILLRKAIPDEIPNKKDIVSNQS